MKFFRKLFGRQRKEEVIKALEQEIEFSVQQQEKQKRYQEQIESATMDGENGWFYRVCVDPKVSSEVTKHGTIGGNAVSAVGN